MRVGLGLVLVLAGLLNLAVAIDTHDLFALFVNIPLGVAAFILALHVLFNE